MDLSSFCVLVFQRFPTDRAYFIAKELLTTERTYVKDLEVVMVVREDRIHSPLWSALCGEVMDYSGMLLPCRVPAKNTDVGDVLGRWDYFIFHSFVHLDLAACSISAVI